MDYIGYSLMSRPSAVSSSPPYTLCFPLYYSNSKLHSTYSVNKLYYRTTYFWSHYLEIYVYLSVCMHDILGNSCEHKCIVLSAVHTYLPGLLFER